MQIVLSDDVSSPSSPSGDSDDNHKTKEIISANQNVLMTNTNYDNTNVMKTISNIFISNNKDDIHIINNNNTNNGRITKNYKRKSYIPYKNNNKKINNITFIDNNLWKQQLTCCGIIYENKLLNSIIINIDMYKPCLNHINSNNKKKTDYIINQDQINVNNNNTSKIPANIHDEIAIKNDELIRHIKLATNFIMNSSVNTSLQNSSILHHHHHYPNNNNNNKIGKISDTVNTNTTAMKKHHLYSKRQNVDVIGNGVDKDNTNLVVPFISSVPSTNVNKISDNTLQTLPINSQQQQQPLPQQQQHTNKYNNYLHKIKETGKIIKNSSSTILNNDKLLTAAVAAAASSSSFVGQQQSSIATTSIKNNKNSLQDLNIVKNLVKLCTEKTTKSKLQINNDSNKNVEILVTNKFSDNSSDSGYEETPQENQQIQQVI